MGLDPHRPRLVDLYDHLVATVPCNPDTPEVREKLSSQSFPSLLRIYLEWVDRFVPPRRRSVFYVPGFWSSPYASKHGGAVLDVTNEIETGVDLTARLSRKVLKEGFLERPYIKDDPRRGIDWNGRDFALSAFDAHHLHLGPRAGRGPQSRELLFVTFFRSHAILLLLGDHGSFDDGTLAEAAASRNLMLGRELRDMHPSRSPWTNKERVSLARRALNSTAMLGGKLVMQSIASGVGTSLYIERHADEIVTALEEIEPRLDDQSYVRQLLQLDGPSAPRPRWLFEMADLVLFDEESQKFLRVVRGHR